MSVRRIHQGQNVRGIAVSAPGVSIRETQLPPAAVAEPLPSATPPPAPTLDTEQFMALSESLGAICEAVAEFEQRRQQSLQELQQLAIEIGFAAAERLLRAPVDRSSTEVSSLVDELTQRAAPAGEFTVVLSPSDLKLLEEAQASQPPAITTEAIRFVSDPTLSPGSCQLKSDGVDVVSILEQELEELKLHMLQELEYAQTERRKPEAENRGVRRYPDRRDTA